MDFVVCKICGSVKLSLTKHITQKHKISKGDYIKMFPEAKLQSEKFDKTMSLINREEQVLAMSKAWKGCRHKEATKIIMATHMIGDKNPAKREEVKSKIRAARMKQILPKKATLIEVKLWEELTRCGIMFERNKAVLGITKPDAFIEPNICVYADGDYWHNLPGKQEKDSKLNKTLEKNNYKVFRFWEHDIHKNIALCVSKIEVS